MDRDDPRWRLARRLRALREDGCPGRKITQHQLAQALGGVSDPLISSWESQSSPKIPPLSRLDAYASLFAAPRSFDDDIPRALAVADMDADERGAMESLKSELRHLRNAALQATTAPAAARYPAPDTDVRPEPQDPRSAQQPDAMASGPWRYADGNSIKIVCAQWPPGMLQDIPYTDINDPDYTELLTYSELDALFELHGHLRAVNPGNEVNRRTISDMQSDDYTAHLVTLGGIDWNTVTSEALDQLAMPVRQVADWGQPDGQYFEVQENGTTAQHRPLLEVSGDKTVLREDVALFARAVNPFNRRRSITICNGMYGRGTYGAVRALTDARFRDRNLEYLQSRFGDSDSYCILTRVPIVNGATLTPDWTVGKYTLFEWSG